MARRVLVGETNQRGVIGKVVLRTQKTRHEVQILNLLWVRLQREVSVISICIQIQKLQMAIEPLLNQYVICLVGEACSLRSP